MITTNPFYEAIPQDALSIRQPWAYAVAMGWKPVENRSWTNMNPARRFRGRFAIHASQGMTRAEYEEAADVFASRGFVCPPPAELERGGIIGVARVVDFVRRSQDPWFFGPAALVIADAKPIEFIPAPGALGFFHWQRGGERMPAKPWMKRYVAEDCR